jgi:hypothetical protein
MRKIIEQCPACAKPLIVTKLTCTHCDTEVTGKFRTNIFDRLSPESLAFAETFVRLRGNIKEMERELGVPYNAVRTRLDDVIGELGFEIEPGPREPEPESSESRNEILALLDKGEIDVAKATEMLSRVK